MKNLGIEFKELREAYLKHPYPNLKERLILLKAIKNLLKSNAQLFAQTINDDFSHRAVHETIILDVFPTLEAIKYCIKYCAKWMKSRPRRTGLLFEPAKSYLFPQPLGVVGIMVPWNYPIFLSLIPLANALCAGNRVMIKVSELTPNTGRLLKELIDNNPIFKEWIKVIEGDMETAKQFSALPFAHLLFTGSTETGKKIMAVASQNLTSLTLELGGKSPVIISTTAKQQLFERIFIGKLFNAGQTCLAPDYLIVPENMLEDIEDLANDFVAKHYPGFPEHKDYTSIIHQEHYDYLLSLLEDAKEKGGKVIQIGQYQTSRRRLPLYLLLRVEENMLIMQKEIFGPILPIITYKNFAEVVQKIQHLVNPLVIYYFGEDRQEIKLLEENTLSGTLSINDTVSHGGMVDIPFGGVGASGFGAYHAQEGFNTFSRLKPVIKKGRWSATSFIYPPYGKIANLFIKWCLGLTIKDFNRSNDS